MASMMVSILEKKNYALISRKILVYQLAQWARKFNKVGAKKTREINFTKYFIDQIPFFAITKMAKNQFLNLEKV